MANTMTLQEAEDLATRTLAKINGNLVLNTGWPDMHAYCRDRVASDLAGMRLHADPAAPSCKYGPRTCPDAARYAEGLRRMAALYGVQP